MNYFKKNLLRYLIQWGILVAIVLFFFKVFGNETFDPEAYCPFGGMQTLITYLTRGSMACSMTMVQIMMGLMLALGVLFFGRLFCSYICPLGLINELSVKLRRVLKIKFIIIADKSFADKLLRAVKYILLFTIFYMTLSSSELFCKNFDPYYAFATGFKGELTVWMASISIAVLFLGSLLVDMFWCKYICPLGALSNIFKFTVMFIGVLLVYWILFMLGLSLSWVYPLAAVVVLGYVLEIALGKAKYNVSLVHINKDVHTCNGCKACVKRCPYHIDIDKIQGAKTTCGQYAKVTHIDCTLCGECIGACNQNSLSIGKCKKGGKLLLPIITAALFGIALYLGGTMELPTIDMRWLPENIQESELKSMEMGGLRSVKCYGSSMAFKAQISKISGVYGVKTFVKHGKVVIYYLPSQTNEQKIQEGVFTPSKFRIMTPDNSVEKVKVITFRTENMHDKMDINYVGMQFRNLNREFYGIESEYACPIIVRLYMGINEQVDAKMLKEIVQMKELDMPQHGGGVKKVACDYKFVEMEEGVDTLALRPYLEKMFTNFAVDFTEKKGYEGKPTAIYKVLSDKELEKPIFTRNLSFISNHLSQLEGIAAVDFILNELNIPTLQITYCTEILDETKILAHLKKETWNIAYGKDDIRPTPAKWKF